jgi:hypothetical protein
LLMEFLACDVALPQTCLSFSIYGHKECRLVHRSTGAESEAALGRRIQSMWNISGSGMLTGLLSGLHFMMSAM